MSLRIGTRGSALALAQAEWVAERIGGTIEVITTSGDRGSTGDKSRWVDTIEAALVSGRIDLAVHSAKDVPGRLALGCEIICTPPRADPRDALIGFASVAELPRGAVVGTSSLRRRAQLLAERPDLHVHELRGNVDTRLRKLDQGEADAIVLAQAGLDRLGYGELHDGRAKRKWMPAMWKVGRLDGPLNVPAPGQGILALEARVGDDQVRRACAGIHDDATYVALRAERAAVGVMEADCHTPVGAHWDGVRLRGFVGRPDGSAWVVDELDHPDGVELGERMLAAGAREILA